MIQAALTFAIAIGIAAETWLPELEPWIRETISWERPDSLSEEILSAAKVCAVKQTRYEMTYPDIPYPGGDVGENEGLCCDVVVRALRAAGIDLQELVYEDALGARASYLAANRWTGFGRPLNRSWVHRRTANLKVFFKRHALELPTWYGPSSAETWQPGDLVIYVRKGWETWHIAVVSDSTDPATGRPMVIDSWSQPGYVSETHELTSFGPIAGHYRIQEELRDTLPEEHKERSRQAWYRYVVGVSEPSIAARQPAGPEQTIGLVGLANSLGFRAGGR